MDCWTALDCITLVPGSGRRPQCGKLFYTAPSGTLKKASALSLRHPCGKQFYTAPSESPNESLNVGGYFTQLRRGAVCACAPVPVGPLGVTSVVAVRGWGPWRCHLIPPRVALEPLCCHLGASGSSMQSARGTLWNGFGPPWCPVCCRPEWRGGHSTTSKK